MKRSPSDGSSSRGRRMHTTRLASLGVAQAPCWPSSAVPASAQSLQTGILTGKVSDNTGARTPGVLVTLTSPALLTPRTAHTDSEGAYRFPSLPPGTYALSFEVQGFSKATKSNIPVEVAATRTVDVTLQVGAMTEAVEVVGETSHRGRDPDQRGHQHRQQRPPEDPHRP